MFPQNKQPRHNEGDSVMKKRKKRKKKDSAAACFQLLSLNMLTIYSSTDQSGYNVPLWLSSKFKSAAQRYTQCVRVFLSIETYIYSSPWFPVVPKDQLQMNGFTSLHLLFQLILERKKSAEVLTFWGNLKEKKNSRNFLPSEEVGSGPSRGNHEQASQSHPAKEKTQDSLWAQRAQIAFWAICADPRQLHEHQTETCLKVHGVTFGLDPDVSHVVLCEQQ